MYQYLFSLNSKALNCVPVHTLDLGGPAPPVVLSQGREAELQRTASEGVCLRLVLQGAWTC